MNQSMNPKEDARDKYMKERIRKAVLGDIQRANDYYTSKIEPVLRLRHQIYEADRAYYRKRFPEVSKQSDFVSFDFWSLVQWAIPSVMNSFFGGDDAVVIVGRNMFRYAKFPERPSFLPFRGHLFAFYTLFLIFATFNKNHFESHPDE